LTKKLTQETEVTQNMAVHTNPRSIARRVFKKHYVGENKRNFKA